MLLVGSLSGFKRLCGIYHLVWAPYLAKATVSKRNISCCVGFHAQQISGCFELSLGFVSLHRYDDAGMILRNHRRWCLFTIFPVFVCFHCTRIYTTTLLGVVGVVLRWIFRFLDVFFVSLFFFQYRCYAIISPLLYLHASKCFPVSGISGAVNIYPRKWNIRYFHSCCSVLQQWQDDTECDDLEL
jgi:hypothetical protein